MRLHLFTVSTFVSLLCVLWTPTISQADTLSDEQYRQEAKTHMIDPCLEEVFVYLAKTAELEGRVTANELMQIVGKDAFGPHTKKLANHYIQVVKGKPENERMIWYRIGLGMCVKAGKNAFRDENPIAQAFGMAESTPPSDDRQDNSVGMLAEEDSDIPDQAKQDAIKTCKDSERVLGTKMSWFMLNACVKHELESYREFQRNYGNR